VNSYLHIFLVLAVLIGASFHILLDRLTERVERQYFEAAEDPMIDAARFLAATVPIPDPGTPLSAGTLGDAVHDALARKFKAQIYNLTKSSVGMGVYLTDASGTVVFDSEENQHLGHDFSDQRDVALTLRGEYGARSSPQPVGEKDEPRIMYVAAPVYRGDEIIGSLTVSKPQASLFAFINETRRHILVLGWLVYGAILSAIALVLYWFSRPLQRLTRYTEAVQRGERPVLKRSRNPEAAALGDALEAMRESLEGRQYVENYVQTLTHEMKSPVAAIRGAAELLDDHDMPSEEREKFLGNIRSETLRIQDSIERLLALSAIESKRGIEHPEPVDLAALVRESAERHQAAAAARGVKISVQAPGTPEIRGDAFVLSIAVSNLIQNAVEFSPEDGTVEVSIERHPEQKMIRVIVSDQGSGIPEFAAKRVFDRFYSLQRPGTGRKSSGLGLCFVKEAAELHRGKASVAHRPDSASASGTEAALELPLP